MERERIVHRVADPLLLQVLLQIIAALRPDRVLVVDALVVPVDHRRPHIGEILERRVVVLRVLPTRRAPPREMRQLRQEHRRLQRVEAAVEADFIVIVGRGRAMRAQLEEPRRDRVVLAHHHAAVAVAAEVLRGEEGEGPDRRPLAGHRPRAADLSPRTDRLRRVLDHGHRRHRRHVLLDRRHLPEEIHRDHGLRLRGHRRLGRGDRKVERVGLDVREHRDRADVVHRAPGREEGERGRDDLIPRPDVERLEREEQRIGAARAADRVLRVRKLGDGLLEFEHRLAEDEQLVFDHLVQRLHDVVLDAGVLGAEIEQRDRHGMCLVGCQGSGGPLE